jgi:hypothetical protein
MFRRFVVRNKLRVGGADEAGLPRGLSAGPATDRDRRLGGGTEPLLTEGLTSGAEKG